MPGFPLGQPGIVGVFANSRWNASEPASRPARDPDRAFRLLENPDEKVKDLLVSGSSLARSLAIGTPFAVAWSVATFTWSLAIRTPVAVARSIATFTRSVAFGPSHATLTRSFSFRSATRLGGVAGPIGAAAAFAAPFRSSTLAPFRPAFAAFARPLGVQATLLQSFTLFGRKSFADNFNSPTIQLRTATLKFFHRAGLLGLELLSRHLQFAMRVRDALALLRVQFDSAQHISAQHVFHAVRSLAWTTAGHPRSAAGSDSGTGHPSAEAASRAGGLPGFKANTRAASTAHPAERSESGRSARRAAGCSASARLARSRFEHLHDAVELRLKFLQPSLRVALAVAAAGCRVWLRPLRVALACFRRPLGIAPTITATGLLVRLRIASSRVRWPWPVGPTVARGRLFRSRLARSLWSARIECVHGRRDFIIGRYAAGRRQLHWILGARTKRRGRQSQQPDDGDAHPRRPRETTTQRFFHDHSESPCNGVALAQRRAPRGSHGSVGDK